MQPSRRVCPLASSVLAQRENEGRNFEEERFRPTGGDFQGIGIYQSDVVEKDGVIEPLRP